MENTLVFIDWLPTKRHTQSACESEISAHTSDVEPNVPSLELAVV